MRNKKKTKKEKLQDSITGRWNNNNDYIDYIHKGIVNQNLQLLLNQSLNQSINPALSVVISNEKFPCLGRLIAAELVNYLESLGMDLSNVQVVGGDGTSVNTG